MTTATRVPEEVVLETDGVGVSPELRRTAEELLPLLYEDIRRIARRERRARGGGETLRTTALIHEAYLKLRNASGYNDRGHFLGAAALAMRHVLVNYARDSVAGKRGSGAVVLPLDAATDVGVPPSEQALLDVNEAVARLSKLSPRLAQVVNCRFFAGYGEEETAQALGLTDRTVRRDWVKARAWLRRELGHGQTAASRPDEPR
jgi:RNA polymerase sigma factor (TIGR02999 family)